MSWVKFVITFFKTYLICFQILELFKKFELVAPYLKQVARDIPWCFT